VPNALKKKTILFRRASFLLLLFMGLIIRVAAQDPIPLDTAIVTDEEKTIIEEEYDDDEDGTSPYFLEKEETISPDTLRARHVPQTR
jgi:hypothetical protein